MHLCSGFLSKIYEMIHQVNVKYCKRKKTALENKLKTYFESSLEAQKWHEYCRT